jgi:hypothetical protein
MIILIFHEYFQSLLSIPVLICKLKHKQHDGAFSAVRKNIESCTYIVYYIIYVIKVIIKYNSNYIGREIQRTLNW